jgi:hypothetical protein
MSLQLQARAEQERRRRSRPPETIWHPNPGPQSRAFDSEATEMFYGGQAGGGKTDLALGLAIMAHRRSIIFRRTYNQLTGADGIIQRSKEILDPFPEARYVGSPTPLWRDIPGDRALEFGAVERESDVGKYKGRPHDLKVFDELPEFTENQYLFLSGWLRTKFIGQRVRILGTGNPPTNADGEWVIIRWGAWLDPGHSNPALPGEIRWYARIDDVDTEVENGDHFEYKGETIQPRSRTFIGASLKDNPFITEDYVATLQSLPEPLRSQLLYGDFSIRQNDDKWQVIKTEHIWKANQRWREWEKAGKPGRIITSMGCDIGSGSAGGDDTVFAYIWDLLKVDTLERPIASDPNKTTMEYAGMIASDLSRNAQCKAIIDAIGIGLGVLQRLLEQNLNADGFIASEAVTLTDLSGTRGFINARAAAWWLVSEMLNPENGFEVCLPPDRKLTADLTAPRYSITSTGKIQIESKESIERRIGRSTDSGDGVVMGLAGPIILENLAKPKEVTQLTYDPPHIGNY